MNNKILIGILILLVVLVGAIMLYKKPANAPSNQTEVSQQGDEELEGSEAEQIMPAK